MDFDKCIMAFCITVSLSLESLQILHQYSQNSQGYQNQRKMRIWGGAQGEYG